MAETTAPEVRYTVKKITQARRMCNICGGTGKRERKTAAGTFKNEPCSWCINGVAWVEHTTEIDLKTALNEMGVYRIIENTVKEVLNKQNVG